MDKYGVSELRDLFESDEKQFEEIVSILFDELISDAPLEYRAEGGRIIKKIEKAEIDIDDMLYSLSEDDYQSFKCQAIEAYISSRPSHIQGSLRKYQNSLDEAFYFHFDFNEWRELFEKSPEKFEKKRRELISRRIESFPEENREGAVLLQKEVEEIIKKSATVDQSLNLIYGMMIESFEGENGLVEALAVLSGRSERSIDDFRKKKVTTSRLKIVK